MNDPRPQEGGTPPDLRQAGRWLIAVIALALLLTVLIRACVAHRTDARSPPTTDGPHAAQGGTGS